MKTWSIPSKTFLLGEYAALAGLPAILLTTTPCFKFTLFSQQTQQTEIHPESPAGIYWGNTVGNQTLKWEDPYGGLGGMGASSAQFVGTYLADTFLNQVSPTQEAMLQAYHRVAWRGQGLKPSGYDVLAQSLSGCVYLSPENNDYETYDWRFDDLAFILVHTGQKLATHRHLQTIVLPHNTTPLTETIQLAKQAFDESNSTYLIQSVNKYYQHLLSMNLVSEHSKQLVQTLGQNPEILAIKGCGAMGADVVLILTPKEKYTQLQKKLSDQGLKILATHENLYLGSRLIENNTPKTLEILT